jgi:parallel beta-helix repeat protein
VSTTLTADLGPCPGNGIVIGKNSITLNLGGHTIKGTATASGYGVTSAGHSAITITNGTIRDFYQGVFLNSTVGAKVNTLRLTGNTTGLYGLGSTTSVISNNVIFSNTAEGIRIQIGGKNTVSNNSLQSNQTGIWMQADTVTISANKISSSTGEGILILAPSNDNILTSNVVNSNASDGIHSADPTAKFTTNTADYNGGLGIWVAPGSVDGGGNHAQENTNARQCTNVVCQPV